MCLLVSLLAGKPVSIGVIGGSISWGHAVNRGVEDWFSVLSGWVNATFPQSRVTARNGCVPATLSEYVSMCLKQFVNDDVDVVFVEVRGVLVTSGASLVPVLVVVRLGTLLSVRQHLQD